MKSAYFLLVETVVVTELDTHIPKVADPTNPMEIESQKLPSFCLLMVFIFSHLGLVDLKVFKECLPEYLSENILNVSLSLHAHFWQHANKNGCAHFWQYANKNGCAHFWQYANKNGCAHFWQHANKNGCAHF